MNQLDEFADIVIVGSLFFGYGTISFPTDRPLYLPFICIYITAILCDRTGYTLVNPKIVYSIPSSRYTQMPQGGNSISSQHQSSPDGRSMTRSGGYRVILRIRAKSRIN